MKTKIEEVRELKYQCENNKSLFNIVWVKSN